MNLPKKFEEFVAHHFKERGYKVVLTPFSGDYGVDIFAENLTQKIAIQVKMYGGTARKVNRESILKLHGAKDYFDCNKAIIVTNGGILEDAIDVANKLGIEIVNLDFEYQSIEYKTFDNSFESIWSNYIIPLRNKQISQENGLTNKIIEVDWSGIKRQTSKGNISKIDIEIFREAYKMLIKHGYVERNYLNQNYIKRGSSGVILVLSQLPFVEFQANPIRLILKKDETSYLLESSNNAARLLIGINEFKGI